MVKRETITVAEAHQRIGQYIKLLHSETVGLQTSFGRTLAVDVVADNPFPPFNRSGMDGYAVRSADIQTASREQPVVLGIVETIPCGVVPKETIHQGQAAKIMTGAMIPAGADAVIMLEMTQAVAQEGGKLVSILKGVRAGENITPVGQEIAAGEVMLEKGRTINAGAAALMASYGYSRASVYRKPKVAIISTGTELVGIDGSLQPGKIRNSNSTMVAAQVESAGGIPILADCISDDVNQLKQVVAEQFSQADMVITTGGVSVGDYDILVDFFQQWEGEMLFNKIAMRPGSPTTAGVWQGKYLFALSGNPSACFVGFELFVRPVLRGMQGMRELLRTEVTQEKQEADAMRETAADGSISTHAASMLYGHTAFLAEDFHKGGAYPRYVRGTRWVEDGKVFTRPTGLDKSSSMLSLKDAECLIIIPAGGRGVKAGQLVVVIPLQG